MAKKVKRKKRDAAPKTFSFKLRRTYMVTLAVSRGGDNAAHLAMKKIAEYTMPPPCGACFGKELSYSWQATRIE